MLKTSTLHKGAFAVLGATTRDDRRRIVELAEQKSLLIDHEICQKARSDLTNPRTRLGAEMAWLPGVSPRRTFQLLEGLLKTPMLIREGSGLPTLAHLNLMAAAFEAVDSSHTPKDVAKFIQEMASLVNKLSVEEVMRDINEDRSVAGFPEVKGSQQIETELSERKRYYRNAIKEALDRLQPASLVETMTAAVEGATCGGKVHAPELLDELVDSYVVETQGFLQKEAENIEKLIKAVRVAAQSGEGAVRPLVDKLKTVARNWDKVAQPIQLSTRARGMDHDPSRAMAYSIRSLAIDLFNEHDMLSVSEDLTKLLLELFAELPEVVERVEEDSNALANIFQQRKQAELHKDDWARTIRYEAEIGILIKDKLRISVDGVEWKGRKIALDQISAVRWGGTMHSVNGIPTGTTYSIYVGSDRTSIRIELKKEQVYSEFIDHLMNAVGARLIGEMLKGLKRGRKFQFDTALVGDDGIELERPHLFRADERVQCKWTELVIGNRPGVFYIAKKDEKDVSVDLSYQEIDNVHILEAAMRAFWKSASPRLSDLLN